jgi:hypothetical protein
MGYGLTVHFAESHFTEFHFAENDRNDSDYHFININRAMKIKNFYLFIY